MPSIGDNFPRLQAQLLQNARLVDRKVTEGGQDGFHYLPRKDTRESYDVDGDGKADVALVTREQDTGAWSYDGKTGRVGVTDRRLELLDKQGRVTDEFEELSAHRKNGHVVFNELRGPEEMTGVVGFVQHVDYAGSQRIYSWESALAKDDGQGNAIVDQASRKKGTATY